MREDVLKRIGELEGVDVAQTELHVCVDHELRQAKNLATQVEGVSEARLLTLLRGQRLDGLQVHVVVEVELVQVLAVGEEVQHVVVLSADLETGLHPVEPRRLEELGGL